MENHDAHGEIQTHLHARVEEEDVDDQNDSDSQSTGARPQYRTVDTPESRRDFVFGRYAGLENVETAATPDQEFAPEADADAAVEIEFETTESEPEMNMMMGYDYGERGAGNGEVGLGDESPFDDYGSMGVQSRSDEILSELALYPDDDDVGSHGSLRVTPTAARQRSAESIRRLRKSGQTSGAVVSRARPLKPHETSPFLSIDNLPVDKKTASKPRTPTNRKQTGSNQNRGISVPYITPTANNSKNKIVVGGYRASGSSSDWNSLVPRRHRKTPVPEPGPVNCHVKAPFKHAVSKPVSKNSGRPQCPAGQRPQSPSQSLKEATAAATQHVARSISQRRVEPESRPQGRLLKSRMKPMNVVKMDGPGMEYCRGIVAGSRMKVSNQEQPLEAAVGEEDTELLALWKHYYHGAGSRDSRATSYDDSHSDTRSHQPSTSKTLQRRRHVLNTIAKEYLYERPQTGESIHRTSVASDLTDTRVEDLRQDLEAIEGEEAREQAVEDPSDDQQPVDGLRMPPNSLASLADPSHESVAPNQYVPQAETIQESPADDNVEVFVTEGRLEAEGATEVTSETSGGIDRAESVGRPRTAQDSQGRKAVRFADENNMENIDLGQRSRSAMPRLGDNTQQGKSAQKKEAKRQRRSEEGCQPAESRQRQRDEDGDDHDDAADRMGRMPRGYSTHQSSTSQGAQQTNVGQSEPSGDQQKSQQAQDDCLHMSVNNVVYGFEDPQSAAPRSTSPQRPRSKLGWWEDPQRPDEDVSRLNISGSGVGVLEAEDSPPRVQPTPPKGKPPGKAGRSLKQRPKSAGPGQQENQRKKKQQRPLSAHAVTVNIDDYVLAASRSSQSATAGSANPTAHNRLPLKSALKAQRPTQNSGTCSGSKSTTEFSFSVQGSRVKESGDCMSCGEPTTKSTQCTSDAGSVSMFRCDRCKGRAHSKEEEEEEEEELGIIQDTGNEDLQYVNEEFSRGEDVKGSSAQAGPVTEQVVDEIKEEVTNQAGKEVRLRELAKDIVQEAMLEGILQHQQNPNSFPQQVLREVHIQDLAHNLVDEVVTDIARDEGVSLSASGRSSLENFEQLERSLLGVQNEIKENLQENSHEEPLHLESYGADAAQPSENIQSRFNPPSQTQMSQQLVGDGSAVKGQYTMTVYHYDESQQSKNGSKVPPQSGPESGSIETYDVTMMGGMNVTGIGSLTVDTAQQIHGGGGTDGLEVRATSKTLNQSKHQKGEADALAPFAPLCFRVNARPPTGYLYYFAYGMDMNSTRLGSYINRPMADQTQWGLLYGFQLRFNKRGVSEQAGGFPNIEFCPTASVEGCLFLITPRELELLDRTMGYPEHYHHVMLPVWLLNCADPDELGVAQYCVPALMYIAKDKWLQHDAKPLTNSYAVDQCLKAGTKLTPPYRQQLASMRRNS